MWLKLFLILICVIVSFINSKIRCSILFKDFFSVFKNYRTKKVSLLDILSFFISPLVMSIIIVYGFKYSFSIIMSNILLTVFSIIFTLLFGVMSLLSTALNSKDAIKSQISKEAFTAVSFSMLSSLLCLILLIIYISLIENVSYIWLFELLTSIILFLTINLIMLFLMIIKRSYVTATMVSN